MNRDQRAVLLHMGVEELLIDSDGWTRLMQSMRGGSGPRGDRPEHSVQSYDCRSNKITAEFHDGTTVVITKANIAKFVRTLGGEVLEQVSAVRDEIRAEHWRTEAWCMCPVQRGVEGARCGGRAAYLPKPVHPSDEEYEKHILICQELRDRLKAALRTALQLDPVPQPGEQMDLFA